MATGTDVKVALITGGADGMGLAIARALAASSEPWTLHILDIKADAGAKVAAELGGDAVVVFHHVDITDYAQLSGAFQTAFSDGGRRRLDLVFANAGIFERSDYFAASADSDEPPPPPDYVTVDVNLKGAINTVHLARHYLARSPEKGSVVITASCSSFWPAYRVPIYTASKFGILGFLRAAAGWFKVHDGIRVNALCPGAVRTSIVPLSTWDRVPDIAMTPLELIADVALKLAHGESFVDGKGVAVPAGAHGLAVVANGSNFYVQDEPEYCDEIMRQTMISTSVERHRQHQQQQ